MQNDFYILGEGEFKDVKFDDFLKKMKILTNTSNSEELAKWLGVRRSIISDARRRNIIPASCILGLVNLFKANKSE